MIKKIFLWIWLGAVILWVAVGCQKVSPTPAGLPTQVVVLPSPTPSPVPTELAGMPASTAEVPRITPQELNRWLTEERSVVLIDVRGHEAFQGGHIPGALDIPYAEIEAQAEALDPEAEIVLYCA